MGHRGKLNGCRGTGSILVIADCTCIRVVDDAIGRIGSRGSNVKGSGCKLSARDAEGSEDRVLQPHRIIWNDEVGDGVDVCGAKRAVEEKRIIARAAGQDIRSKPPPIRSLPAPPDSVLA